MDTWREARGEGRGPALAGRVPFSGKPKATASQKGLIPPRARVYYRV
jgi:hypothetical protein